MTLIYVFCLFVVWVLAYGPARRASDRLGHGIGFLGSARLSAADIERLAELARTHSEVRHVAKKWVVRKTKLRVRHLHYAEEIAENVLQRAEWLANEEIEKQKLQSELPRREKAAAVLAASVRG